MFDTGRIPEAVSRAWTLSGATPTVTPRITRARYRGHLSESMTSTVAARSARSDASASDVSGTPRGTPVAALTSLATPTTDNRSGRFASTSRSRTASSNPNAALKSDPTGTSSVRTRIPLWSAESPSSRGEHNMPCDSIPRIFRADRGSGSPGTRAPGPANGTRSPGFMFLTPTTSSRWVPPASTRARHSLSELGWSRTSTTLATTTPASPSQGRTMDSTCKPFMSRIGTSSSAERSIGQNSRSHDRTTLMECSPLPGELLEEPDVALPKQADVGDAKADHGQPVVPHPEGEPRVALGVVAHVLQHHRMNHPGAGGLDPAGVAARAAALPTAHEAGHLDLSPRLDEREERRSEADFPLRPEERPIEGLQRALEVGEGDPLVHRQALHLMEDRHVLRGDLLVAKDAARHDHVDGRLPRLHGPDLHGRGVRSKQQLGVLGQVEEGGVHHGARRVVGRDVQGIEVVPLGLHLRTLHHLVPHAGEDVDHFVLHDRQRVQRARAEPSARKGNVYEVPLQDGPVALGLQLGSASGKGPPKGFPDLVGSLADPLAVVVRQGSQGALNSGERRSSPQHRDLGFIQRLDVGSSGDQRAPSLELLIECPEGLFGVRPGHGGWLV